MIIRNIIKLFTNLHINDIIKRRTSYEKSIYNRSIRTVGESGERGRLKICRGQFETDTVHYLIFPYSSVGRAHGC